jgi:hypothetical protein
MGVKGSEEGFVLVFFSFLSFTENDLELPLSGTGKKQKLHQRQVNAKEKVDTCAING